jgi:hypothetical protein
VWFFISSAAAIIMILGYKTAPSTSPFTFMLVTWLPTSLLFIARLTDEATVTSQMIFMPVKEKNSFGCVN